MTPSPKPAGQPVALYLTIAGLVAMAVGVTAASLTGVFDREATVRAFGILMGMLMVVAGNALPKVIRPGQALRAAERLAGWVFVLGGLWIIGLWIWTPFENSTFVTSAAGLGIFAFVLLAGVCMTRGQATTPALSPEMRRSAISQRALFHILHAVMWVFAMFLAGEMWGRPVVAWLSGMFAVALAALDMWLAAPLRQPKTPA